MSAQDQHPAQNASESPSGNTGEQRVVYSSSILFEKQPVEAMEALVIRRQQAKQINKELAEWFTAYGRLRLHYVDELKKIHKRGAELFTDKNPTLQTAKLDALGLCTPMWSDVLKNVDNEINLFDQSTRKMGRDMIAPLRLFTRNNDSNLVEMDQLIEIATGLQNSNKGGVASASYEDEWSRKGPYFFEIFENYDYQRLLLLKDVFLKYQTDLGDVVSQFKKDNETGLEHVLNFDVDDEITRFSQDVIATTLPIENIKVDAIQNSRTTADGFTSSAATSSPSRNNKESKRHSNLLSPHRFHLKKNGEHEHENGDHESVASNTKNEAHPQSKRLSSSTSLFSSSTSTDKKKEKGVMRSKFGSMFKGRKKNNKDSGFVPPSTIREPDNASVITETTTGSSRAPASTRQRNHSVISHGNSVKHYAVNDHHQSPPQQSPLHYQAQPQIQPQHEEQYEAVAVPESVQPPPSPTDARRAQHPYRQSSFGGSSDSKPLPEHPSAADSPSMPPPPQIENHMSESSLYEPMRPTKRSDSLSNTNIPSQIPSASSVTNSSLNTPPVSATTGVTSVPQATRGMDNIPEAIATTPQENGVAPPPPSARKHTTSDYGVNNSIATSRQPRTTAPTPPTQRKSMLLDPQQQPLQPAPTGTQQSEDTAVVLERNTTGNGGLVGGTIIHPSLTTAGFNASIVELFNATFKDGVLTRSTAIGEVAFSFISDDNQKLPSEISLQVSSKKEGVQLPNFAVNTMLLQESSPGAFTITDPSQILMRTVGALKYMLNDTKPPIVVTPIWKHENNQSTVIISVKPTPELTNYLQTGSLTLSGFMLSVSVKDALVSSAATKPPGSLNKEKGRVTWISQTPIVFNAAKQEERFIARFMTNKLASESETGVQVKFNITNEDGAGRIDFLNTDMEIQARGEIIVEDPFGDGLNKQVDDWSDVPTLKTIVAGSYSGHSGNA